MKKIKYGNKGQSGEIWRQLGKAAKILHFQIRLNLGPTLAPSNVKCLVNLCPL